MKNSDLHEKSLLLTLLRLIVALVLLAATLLFGVGRELEFLSSAATELVFTAVTAVLLLCAISGGLLERWDDEKRLRVVAYAQFAGDALFATCLVILTGGCDSVFTFLYSLAIINASVLLYRRGALFTASANSVCLAFVAMGQTESFGDSLNTFVAAGDLFGDSSGFVRDVKDVLPYFSVNLLAFYVIALLSSFLAEQLRAADVAVEERKLDLKQLANFHENVVSSLENGLLTVNLSRTIMYVNQTACRILGRDQENTVNRKIEEFFPDMGPVLENPDKTSGSHTEVTMQMLGGRKVYLRWSISPLKDSEEMVVGHILLFFDITVIKEMEEEVHRSERLAAVGRLAANIAHEIRNPLASMSGSIQLLRNTLEVEGEDRKLMDIVVREADNLNRWISEFLEYARPQEPVVGEVDFAELAREVVEMLRHDERAIGVRIDYSADEDCRMDGDRSKLRQVVWNLVLNAMEAVSGDGGVAVEIRGEPGTLSLSVSDSGPGISAELASRIFEPFFTTRQNGTGLGLATVHRNVEEHHGSILVVSGNPLEGASFVVVLPRRAPAPGISPDSVSPGRQ